MCCRDLIRVIAKIDLLVIDRDLRPELSEIPASCDPLIWRALLIDVSPLVAHVLSIRAKPQIAFPVVQAIPIDVIDFLP